MASLPHHAVPLEALLSALPSLPRPLLARLTMRLIEKVDEIDADPDLEDDDLGGGNITDEPHDQEADDEREQMIGDVPCLRVFAIEPDPVTGQRQFLGMSNLSPAFVASPMPASV